jgi:hypothetical protein
MILFNIFLLKCFFLPQQTRIFDSILCIRKCSGHLFLQDVHENHGKNRMNEYMGGLFYKNIERFTINISFDYIFSKHHK